MSARVVQLIETTLTVRHDKSGGFCSVTEWWTMDGVKLAEKENPKTTIKEEDDGGAIRTI